MLQTPTQLELIGRLALAALFGALIGLEREFSEKPAGLRTHALVALGAATFTVGGFAAMALPDAAVIKPDPTRIAAQVVSGIGFLGAGIIIFHGDRLRGLTTAAELWTVAALGLLCGLGLVAVAGAATAVTLVVVVGGRPIEHAVDRVRVRRLRREHARDRADAAGDDELDVGELRRARAGAEEKQRVAVG